ncbi:MAG: carbohydrate porin [Candidatus Korobacteraceae bacterium]
MKGTDTSKVRSSGGISAAFVLALVLLVMPSRTVAQLPDITAGQKPEPETVDETVQTMFPHSSDSRFWISGQMNSIFQANLPFYAQYSGAHSFQPHYEDAISHVETLYTGFQISGSGEILVDAEEAGGLGLSGSLGIAGFPNLDAARDALLSEVPYLARLMYHQVIALSPNKTEAARGPLSTFSELPTRRLEIRVGKFGMTDFFDANAVGSDSHLQFMNWAVDQNGGYDFTADPRGYTWGVLAEYQCPKWGLRFAEALLPGPNNGDNLEWNLRKANTSNVEFELHRGFLKKKDGVIRVLAYVNNGNMGIYDYANEQYLEGKVAVPSLADHPQWVTTKYGFGFNFEQVLGKNLLAYGRFGWNNGKTESWSFTEIDQTFSGGIGATGRLWKRRYDRAGVAFASNGITKEHQQYLAYGGLGFLLGDGGLRYGRESLVESYYTAHVWRGLFLGPDLQYIVNPGYNQVRGPVVVPSFRVHVEL